MTANDDERCVMCSRNHDQKWGINSRNGCALFVFRNLQTNLCPHTHPIHQWMMMEARCSKLVSMHVTCLSGTNSRAQSKFRAHGMHLKRNTTADVRTDSLVTLLRNISFSMKRLNGSALSRLHFSAPAAGRALETRIARSVR